MPDNRLFVDIQFQRPRSDFRLEVAFEAQPGVTVLFGPSGSGKSTVLAAIAGLLRPDAGKITLGDGVWFDGASGKSLPIEARRVAFVFQSLALFPHMTAAENAEYGVSRSVPKPERRRRAVESLARFRVAHLADRRPATFSGGEAQRVALARAFAMSPAAVLLDEPFSALDFTLRQQFVAELRAVARDLAVPIVHVTHHRNEARALADRAILLDHGRIAGDGPIDQVLPALDRRPPLEGRDDTTDGRASPPRAPLFEARSPGDDARSPGTDPRAPGTDPRSPGTDARAPGTDPRAEGTADASFAETPMPASR
ncbi:MAG: ATP-binding cassette domain-containing protein [Polyangiaceae bacterium]